MILPHNDTGKKLLDKSVVRLSLLFFARMAVLLKCYQKKSKSVRIIWVVFVCHKALVKNDLICLIYPKLLENSLGDVFGEKKLHIELKEMK